MSLEKVLAAFKVVRTRKDEYDVLCPVHGDKHASASISVGETGAVLVHCMAGCAPEEIVRAAGLEWSDLFPDSDINHRFEKDEILVAEYVYTDEDSRPLFRVQKFRRRDGKKHFKQQASDGNGGWASTLGEAKKTLYHFPEVKKAALLEKRILYVEGEACVEALRNIGLVATTHPGGSGAWKPEYAYALHGAEVVILPDNDAPGRKMAQQILADVRGSRVFELPGLPDKGDVVDWLRMGHTKEDLLALLGPEAADMTAVDWLAFHEETDKLTYYIGDWLAAQTLVMVVAPGSAGKAQPLDSKVLTPTGWVEIGKLRKGDKVIGGSDGKPCVVNGVFRRGKLPVFEVKTQDGHSCRCAGDHLWRVIPPTDRSDTGKVIDTMELSRTLVLRTRPVGNEFRWAIPTHPQVEFEKATEPLPIAPYLLGSILADGTSDTSIVIHDEDPHVLARCRKLLSTSDVASDHSIRGIRIRRKRRAKGIGSDTMCALEALGLRGKRSWEKFIPKRYLFASKKDRLELLRALSDTDGHVNGQEVQFSFSSKQLSEDVSFLAMALGYWCSRVRGNIASHVYKGEHRAARDRFRFSVRFGAGDPLPFSSPNCIARNKGRVMKSRRGRTIASVERAGAEECICISVSDANGLYITDGMMVTHNTTFTNQLCICLAAGIDFLGYKTHSSVPVLLVEAEGARPVFRSRAATTASALGIKPKQLANRWFLQDARLNDFDLSSSHIERHIRTSGARVVVLDTLGYFLSPGDENSSKDWKERVVKPMRYLRTRYGCTFIILHHEGKPSEFRYGEDRGRGTKAIYDDCDVWLSLESPRFTDDTERAAIDAAGEATVAAAKREKKLTWYKSKVGPFPQAKVLDLDTDSALFRVKHESDVERIAGILSRRRKT